MTKSNQTEITQREPFEVDLGTLVQDFLRGLRKRWWLPLILAAIFAIGGLLYSIKLYQPIYAVEATFTVETYSTQSGYTFFYDTQTAAQMARTFPFLLDSDLLLERVKTDLGVAYLNGVPSAEVINNSNIFYM